MNNNKTYLLAYHPANFEEANKLTQRLGQTGYKLIHKKSSMASVPGEFAQMILTEDLPTIFLISDNFLKSEDCTLNLLDTYKELQTKHQIISIICEGKIKGDSDFEQVKTDFSKLSGILKYLNYWQNKYLEVRAKKQSITTEEEETYNLFLKTIRSISTEIGDFLKEINQSEPLDFNFLELNNFEPFYNKIGDKESFQVYLKQLALEAELEMAPVPKENIGDPVKESDPDVAPSEGPSVPNLQTSDEVMEEIDQEIQLHKSDTSLQTPLENIDILFETDDDEVDENNTLFTSENIIKNKTNSTDKIDEANASFKLGKESEGLEILRMAVENHPNDSDLRYEYSAALVKYSRNFDLAKSNLKKVLENDEKHAKSLFLLARMSELEGNGQQALDYYSNVLEAQNNFPEAAFRVALLTLKYRPQNFLLSESLLENEINKKPENEEAQYRLGTIYAEKTNKPDRAMARFQKVLTLNKNHPFANYDLALLYFKKGELAQARYFYKKATKINAELKTTENDLAFGVKDSPSEMKISITTEKMAVKKQVETKLILITGATSGIGKATAQIFAKNGYQLILTGRRLERLEALKAEFENQFESVCHVLSFDIRNQSETEAAIKSLPTAFQKIDILINNAGLAKGFSPIHEGNLEHWETMIDTNVKGLLYMTRLVAPLMVANQQGHIINIASTAGKEVYTNGNVYCASKFAVDALTKGMRLDLHQHNIRVSQVAPGHVEETEFAEVRFDGDKEKAKIYEDFKPLSSIDVAEILYFVATRPAHVNIQDVLVMGTQQASSTVIDRSGR